MRPTFDQRNKQAYVDAVAHDKVNGLADVLDKDIKFTTTRGEQIINHVQFFPICYLRGGFGAAIVP